MADRRPIADSVLARSLLWRWTALLASAIALTAIRTTAQEPAGPAAEAPNAVTPNALDAAPEPELSAEANRSPSPPGDEASSSSAHRLREGTQLKDRLGRFRQNGDSLTFIDEDGRELGGLPNLSLERIIRMLKTVEEPDSVKWSVSGTVTEFAGRNYLLVSRAVYKAATLPPAPDAVQ
jgi:hypothetical protein